MKDFGSRLKKLREGRGYTQTRFAKLAGLASGCSLSYLERGAREPTLQTVIGIADLTGVTLDYLVGRPVLPGSKSEIVVRAFQALTKQDQQFAEDFLAFMGRRR
jgi:transcriptional regulator with XRE-family HTH domain